MPSSHSSVHIVRWDGSFQTQHISVDVFKYLGHKVNYYLFKRGIPKKLHVMRLLQVRSPYFQIVPVSSNSVFYKYLICLNFLHLNFTMFCFLIKNMTRLGQGLKNSVMFNINAYKFCYIYLYLRSLVWGAFWILAYLYSFTSNLIMIWHNIVVLLTT